MDSNELIRLIVKMQPIYISYFFMRNKENVSLFITLDSVIPGANVRMFVVGCTGD